jgi:hypothetical protein
LQYFYNDNVNWLFLFQEIPRRTTGSVVYTLKDKQQAVEMADKRSGQRREQAEQVQQCKECPAVVGTSADEKQSNV